MLSDAEIPRSTQNDSGSDVIGLLSFRDYWADVILRRLAKIEGDTVSIRELSTETAISPQDIIRCRHGYV
jgi:hypothetical protein